MILAVVTVAFGAPELLEAALEPLRGLPAVVVDNSSDTEVALVAAAHGARYVDPGSNLGFAAGVNVGMQTLVEQFGAVDVLVLNPDAVITRGGVECLHAALRADDAIAAVAPRLEHTDGSPQRALWPWPSPGGIWREAFGLGRLNDRHADWLVGAVLLLRAEAWGDVGPFDERFFLYQEETDWQRRAVARGWQVRLVESVVARHVGAATSVDPIRREVLFHAGTETYIRKWFGLNGWRAYRIGAMTGALARCLLPGNRRAMARRRATLYWVGPRAAAGMAAASESAASTSSPARRQE